jgi:hypothetical protein
VRPIQTAHVASKQQAIDPPSSMPGATNGHAAAVTAATVELGMPPGCAVRSGAEKIAATHATQLHTKLEQGCLNSTCPRNSKTIQQQHSTLVLLPSWYIMHTPPTHTHQNMRGTHKVQQLHNQSRTKMSYCARTQRPRLADSSHTSTHRPLIKSPPSCKCCCAPSPPLHSTPHTPASHHTPHLQLQPGRCACCSTSNTT